MRKINFLLLLLLTVLISWGQTLQMFFWRDDFALMFKAQHPLKGAGHFGAGILGTGPYKFQATPFIFLYKLFGLNASYYFAFLILVYFVLSLLFFYFVKTVTGNKKIAAVAALIFAAGYTANETFFKLINSFHTFWGMATILLALTFYYKAVKEKRIFYYFFSLLLFYISLTTVVIRSHGLVIGLLAFEFFFFTRWFKIKSILKSLLRLSPFIFAFYKVFLISEGARSANTFKTFLAGVFYQGRTDYLFSIFSSIGYLLLPQPIIKLVSKLWLIESYTLAMIVGVLVLLLSFSLAFLSLRRKRETLARIFFFVPFWMVTNILSFHFLYAGAPIETTSRYLSYSTIGSSLFLSALFWFLFTRRKRLFFLASAAAITTLVFLNVADERRIVINRSLPVKSFYKTLKKEVKEIPYGSVFFLDKAGDSDSRSQAYEFFAVGFMPNQTAIAIFYNIDRYDLALIEDNFEEILYLLDKEVVKIDKIFTFYYDARQGTINTTKKTREILNSGGKLEIPQDELEIKKLNEDLLISLKRQDIPSLTPILVKLKMEVKMMEGLMLESQELKDVVQEKIEVYVDYLLAKKRYYQMVKIASDSDWPLAETYKATDGDLLTSWMGHRIAWADDREENVILDLGEIRTIGSLAWISSHPIRTPIKYTLFSSLDGEKWKEVKKTTLNEPVESGKIVRDELEAIKARFIKMKITKTAGDDSPGFSEIEAIEARFNNVDLTEVEKFKERPFNYVSNLTSYQRILNYYSQEGGFKVCWRRDKDINLGESNCQEVPLRLGEVKTYDFFVKAGGRRLEELRFEFNCPCDVKIENIGFETPNFEVLQEKYKIPEVHYLFDIKF